jgi:hypothetical protein
MTTIVPRTGIGAYLGRDTWRARGFGAITGLPSPYGESQWLAKPIEPDEIAYSSWLRRNGDAIEVGDLRAAFDVLAVPRANEMLRQLYAEMFSRMSESDRPVASEHTNADFGLLDLERHVRSVLRPLVAWAEAPRTLGFVAEQTGRPPAEAEKVLAHVAEVWGDQLDVAWLAAPKDGAPTSVAAMLTSHLALTQDSLRSLLRTPPDARANHRDVALLFAGHYFAHAPLERLWAESMEDTTWPSTRLQTEDVFARWFWGAWQRVLERLDDETTTP